MSNNYKGSKLKFEILISLEVETLATNIMFQFYYGYISISIIKNSALIKKNKLHFYFDDLLESK